MLKVALTGNIASGKSSVLRVWRDLGASVVDADQLARQVVEPGTPGLQRIVHEWGKEILAEDGSLDRARMRSIVFSDPAARARLEAIIHPAVAALRDEAYRQAAAEGEPLVVADVPLLFEVGMEEEFDVVVLVDASPETRLARLVGDRGLAHDEALRMIEAQLPAAVKRERADIVIDNAGTLEDLEQRSREVWEDLRARARHADDEDRA